MATIPVGTKFLGVDPNFTDLTERKGTKVDRQTEYFSLEEITATIGVGSEGPQGIQGPAGPPGPVGPAGLNWQGAWDTDSSYAVDDAVGFNGASWFCISEVTGTGNSNPEEDTESWALLAAQGAVGPQGPQGPTGPQGPSGTETYKSYVAWISQSGTNNPVITEIYNTIGPITWVRSSAGNYTGTAAANTFPLAKTFFPQKQFCRASEPGFIRNIYMNAGFGNIVYINQNDGTTGVDNLNWQFEIRVYN